MENLAWWAALELVMARRLEKSAFSRTPPYGTRPDGKNRSTDRSVGVLSEAVPAPEVVWLRVSLPIAYA